jgi:hypothetical protein
MPAQPTQRLPLGLGAKTLRAGGGPVRMMLRVREAKLGRRAGGPLTRSDEAVHCTCKPRKIASVYINLFSPIA